MKCFCLDAAYITIVSVDSIHLLLLIEPFLLSAPCCSSAELQGVSVRLKWSRRTSWDRLREQTERYHRGRVNKVFLQTGCGSSLKFKSQTCCVIICELYLCLDRNRKWQHHDHHHFQSHWPLSDSQALVRFVTPSAASLAFMWFLKRVPIMHQNNGFQMLGFGPWEVGEEASGWLLCLCVFTLYLLTFIRKSSNGSRRERQCLALMWRGNRKKGEKWRDV